ncbi:FliM/FliN family flagellar motor switch protein [Planctomyces sp. SH-PL62]|uniref:FliM/FliN family flagellar motor switch protein n=1 Tax=Planctomyces sp. SH-PL62 TaxID=1636152 RepID=UPI00078CDCD1|nr:FliM/FliN family flagellar motor switch protein [Planctomyces sp. SH-PL62]AMV39034.1 Flagellar motor switch protein FliN [Planctomyces sp. SH-PL62]
MTADDGSAHVWDGLPRLSAWTLALERRAEAWREAERTRAGFAWIAPPGGLDVAFDRPEVEGRAAALGRPGLVAQFRWPRLRTRLAFGVEVPIVHAVVDGLLGFDRPFADVRLQTTPVEWGVWTYLVTRALEQIADSGASPFRFGGQVESDAPDLSIDRVGPSPFDVEGLGEVVTIRWAVRVGSVAGAVRLWIPASLAVYWVDSPPHPRPRPPFPPSAVDLASEWRAVAGRASMPLGLEKLRVGAVLPLARSRLAGTPTELAGSLDLICRAGGDGPEYRIAVEPAPGSSGRRVRVAGPLLQRSFTPGDEVMSTSSEPARPESPVADPLDAPVTLTVEIGRLSLPVSRLADLKPGDLLELNRHTREPVEITSGGRLIARGDLVLIDAEMGVRVTSVFL